MLTSRSISVAKKPRTEKMANPAKTEVRQLPKQTMRVSLERGGWKVKNS